MRRGPGRSRAALLGLALLGLAGCAGDGARLEPVAGAGRAAVEMADMEERYRDQRTALLDELRRDGIADPRVLAALASVPRHRFVPEDHRHQAYGNYPLPIGQGQTISQPYIVALMTEVARVGPTSNVLEVGTGSGYQAAVLAEVVGRGPRREPAAPAGRVCSVEILPELGEGAARLLGELGFEVEVRIGDGYRGWPERAPFDAILVTAAPDHVPEPLRQQLAPGGRLVIPVGRWDQELLVVTRTAHGFDEQRVLPVRFVPMTGEAERGR